MTEDGGRMTDKANKKGKIVILRIGDRQKEEGLLIMVPSIRPKTGGRMTDDRRQRKT
jgi:hypothetical protein